MMRILHPNNANATIPLSLTTDQVWECLLAHLNSCKESEGKARPRSLCFGLLPLRWEHSSFEPGEIVPVVSLLLDGQVNEAASLASRMAAEATNAQAWQKACCARLLWARAHSLCQEESVLWTAYLTALLDAEHSRAASPLWLILTFFLMAQEMADNGDVEYAVSHYQRAINMALKNQCWEAGWFILRQMVGCLDKSDQYQTAQLELRDYLQEFSCIRARDLWTQGHRWLRYREEAWQAVSGVCGRYRGLGMSRGSA